jgi:PII-like signaling protein
MLMRIYLSESRSHHGKRTFDVVVKALEAAGIAGATAFKGIEGYGSHRYVSSADVVDAWVDLPVLIEVVDEEAAIRAFLPTLESILDDGLVTLERVQILLYRTESAETAVTRGVDDEP